MRSYKTTLLLSCLFFAVSAFAQDKGNFIWPVKLQKSYSKSYPVGTEQVVLLNRYGKMNIETWDRNEVSVVATIAVGAQNNDYAAKLLERINILDEKKTASIEFKTDMGDSHNNWSDDNNGGHEMHIDWTVKIPANAKLHAENHFGPMDIGDYKGEAELICKYGTLTAGKLSNSKLVTVEFGKAIIASVSDAQLLLRYSRVDISKLSGNIKAEMQFCNSVDLPIDNDLKQLELKNNYTSLYLMIPKDLSADYDITTNNARVSTKNEALKEEKQDDPNIRRVSFSPNHHYVGSLGKGGGTRLLIRSNFGNIRIL